MPDRPPANYRTLTVASGVMTSARRTPDKTAVFVDDRSLTFAALAERINKVGNAALSGLGLATGDRAAILASNCLEYFEIVCGLSAAGIAVATLNPRLAGREIEQICADCTPRVLLVSKELSELARSLDLPSIERTIVIDAAYEDWLARASGDAVPSMVAEWDAFAIPYTSGTTGVPKGVVLPHRSRVTTFFAMAAEYGCYGPDDRYLAVAPLYHGAGFAFALASTFFGGTCRVLPAFEPDTLVRLLNEDRYNGTFMVPTHFHAIFELDPAFLDKHRDFALKSIVSNAAPLPQVTKEKIVDYFGDGLLHETYGSTEAGIVTNLRPQDQLRKTECVGQAFPCTEIRLLDDDGRDVAPGEVGELFSNSPYLFNGYWEKPDETAASMRDGWFSAGDLARRDEEGFFFLVDRKKDMIISGGLNIYPREIEEVLFRHPAIRDVAVIGEPDERWGESVAAFVVVDDAAGIGADEIRDYCKDQLAGMKTPKRIELVGALPRNAAGKVLKTELRTRATSRAA